MSMIIHEADLQTFADEYLELKRIPFYRIPDKFWKWIQRACPTGIRCWLFSMFGGFPDNLVLLPINDRFSLAVCLELKKPGAYMRKGQKEAAARMPWIVVKSPEEFESVINEAKAVADEMSMRV